MLRTLFHRLHLIKRRKRTIVVSPRLGHTITDLANHEDRPTGDLVNTLLETGLENYQLTEDLKRRWGSLTCREREVALLVLQGYKYNQIAGRLTISVETVKTHVHRILGKFGMDSTRKLGHAMRKAGILEQKPRRRASKEDDKEFRLKYDKF